MECDQRTAPAPGCKYYSKGGLCRLPYMFRCIEYVYSHEAPLSYSSMRDFCQCKRKYYHSTIQGLIMKPEQTPIRMLMGSIWSEVLDEIHKKESVNNSVKDRIAMVLAKYKTNYVFKTDTGKQIPKELAAIQALSDYYGQSDYAEVKGTPQAEFRWILPDYPEVHGYIDLLVKLSSDAPCWAYEFKYSQQPDNMLNRFVMSDQLTTYFLGYDNLQRITVRAFQVPMLEPGRDKNMDSYTKRVYNDIVSRPKHYIKESTFWRSEFRDDMEMVKVKANLINEDIHRTPHLFSEGGLGVGAWIQNKLSCFVPSPCQYLPICENGNISDDIYIKREVKL